MDGRNGQNKLQERESTRCCRARFGVGAGGSSDREIFLAVIEAVVFVRPSLVLVDPMKSFAITVVAMTPSAD